MALPTSYLTSTKNLESVLNAIKGAQAPDKFNQQFIESLGFTSSSERLIGPVLKSLGLLGDAGKPTERYFRFLDQSQSALVLAEGLRESYQDLFKINIKANELSRIDLINKFKTLSQGQLSDSVLDKMALTFLALVKLADFSGFTAAPVSQAGTTVMPEEQTQPKQLPFDEPRSLPLKLGGLVYNIQIVLPESRDPAVYDALFQSLRKHIM